MSKTQPDLRLGIICSLALNCGLLHHSDMLLELSCRDLALEHLLDLGVVATLQFWETEEEVDTHGERGGEENEGDLSSEIGLIGVKEVGHDLCDETGDGSRGHDVDTVGLLTQFHAIRSQHLSQLADGTLLQTSQSHRQHCRQQLQALPGRGIPR